MKSDFCASEAGMKWKREELGEKTGFPAERNGLQASHV